VIFGGRRQGCPKEIYLPSGCKLVRNRQGAVMAKPEARIVKRIGPAPCVASSKFSGHKSNQIA